MKRKMIRQVLLRNLLVESRKIILRIGDLTEGVITRRKDPVNYLEMIENVCFTSKIEPKNVTEVLNDEFYA